MCDNIVFLFVLGEKVFGSDYTQICHICDPCDSLAPVYKNWRANIIMEATGSSLADRVENGHTVRRAKLRPRSAVAAAAIFAAIAFGISPLNFVLAGVLGYSFTPALTAALLLIFPLMALCVLYGSRREPLRWSEFVSLLAAAFVFFVWAANYAVGVLQPLWYGDYGHLITAFDLKRPFFFVVGFFVSALIGITASRDYEVFIPAFLKAVFVLSIVVSTLYLLTYDPYSDLNRLGGDAGLSIGILLSEGLSSGLALIFMYRRVVLRWLFPVPIVIAGILMSGTRAALVSVAVSCVAASMLRPKQGFQYAKYLVPLAVAVAVAVYALDFVPAATVERITTFRLEGSQSRMALLRTGVEEFLDDPFGRVVSYDRVFPAGIEYAHNTLLQMLLEGGVLILIPLCIVGFFALRNIVRLKKTGKIGALLVFYAGVFTHSLSSGDAYTAPLWFCTFLLATLPKAGGEAG